MPCSNEALALIPRASWGAAAPNLAAPNEHGRFDPRNNPEGWLVYDQPLAQVLNTIIVHHSSLPFWQGPREVQQLHMQQWGFADIGYHFLINLWGQLYEGRSLTVRGAHTAGFNTGTIGVVLLDNFEQYPPTVLQLGKLTALGRCLAQRYSLTHLAGHRDFLPGQTVCPGRYLEPLLPNLAAELGLTFGTGGYAPPQY